MLLKFYMCRNRPGIVPMLATSFQLPDHYTIVSHFARHTMWFICIDIFKIVNWKWTVSVEIHNNSSLSWKWDQILSWIYEVIYIIYYVIICIFFFFFFFVHAIHKVYYLKKSAVSPNGSMPLFILLVNLFHAKLYSLWLYIFIVWNIMTLN